MVKTATKTETLTILYIHVLYEESQFSKHL